jgi:hypothetical protein
MAVTTPEWLTRHGCELRPILRGNGKAWAVFCNDEPNYLLELVPVAGKFGCKVTQTNNGRRLDGGASHPTEDEALQGGLEDLRKALGW